MSELREVKAWIDERLPALLDMYDVPAAAWGVLRGDEVVDGAAGLLSRTTMVEATTDSVFQVGSITKLWTSTLVMQLADEGRIDIDEPVRRYLPEFRIADPRASERITVRQLLTHTSGFEGDIFTDTGVGDDCVEKYVATLRDVPQLIPPGERFSYNNAGYCVLGRLVEVLLGKPYDVCLRERLLTPLGLSHAATGPHEAIMFRAAVGHVEPEPGARCEPAPVWALARSNAPAGSTLAMRPRDLLAFARMHLEDGRSTEGRSVLAPGTAARMHALEVGLPDLGLMGTSWGLGFERYDTANGAIIGHDGTTIGQDAFLRMVPEAGVAVVLLTNGGEAHLLSRDIVGHVLGSLTSVSLPELPAPPSNPERIDARRYVGTYSAQVADLILTQDDDGRIWMEQIPKGVFEELGEKAERIELVHYKDGMLIPLFPDHGMYMPRAFVGDDGSGHAQYLHIGRVVRRVDA